MKDLRSVLNAISIVLNVAVIVLNVITIRHILSKKN